MFSFCQSKFAASAVSLIFSLHCSQSARAQDAAAPAIVVRGDELPSAYGAPPAFSRTRFAPLTTAYVLPPGTFLAAKIYEGDIGRHGPPDHQFTQELEVGLPHRFGLAAEASFESFEGTMQGRTLSLEARYAVAVGTRFLSTPRFLPSTSLVLVAFCKKKAAKRKRARNPRR